MVMTIRTLLKYGVNEICVQAFKDTRGYQKDKTDYFFA